MRLPLLLAFLVLPSACDKKDETAKSPDPLVAEETEPAKPAPRAEPPTEPTDKPDVVAPVTPMGWHVSRLGDAFRFETPGIPTRSVDKASGITTYQIKDKNHYYMVQTMAMPDFLAEFLDDETAIAAGFAKAEENMLKAMSAKATEKAKRLKVLGMDANEVVASGVQGGQPFYVVARQIVDAKANRLYQMMLLRPGARADETSREKFFGSFQKRAPKK